MTIQEEFEQLELFMVAENWFLAAEFSSVNNKPDKCFEKHRMIF